MSDYLKNSSLLEDQFRKTLDKSFSALSKKELLALKQESYTYYSGSNTPENREKLTIIESRINDRLSSITAKNRFSIQIFLSILILIVGVSTLALRILYTEPSQTAKEQHKK